MNLSMNDDIVAVIRDFVEAECRKPTSKYGYDPFSYHFTPVADYAGKLSDKLGGDKEVILIAAWLHDIGSIVHGRENHHETGAIIAREKLSELGYPEERVALVEVCIRNHRGSVPRERMTLEEQIVAEADVLSAFENISGIFKAAFVYEGLDQGQAIRAVRKKLENKWNQIHFESSRELVRPKYDAVKILLSEI